MKLRYLLKLGIILCLCVLIYCLFQLYHIYDDYQLIEANTEAIRETASAELFDENDLSTEVLILKHCLPSIPMSWAGSISPIPRSMSPCS